MKYSLPTVTKRDFTLGEYTHSTSYLRSHANLTSRIPYNIRSITSRSWVFQMGDNSFNRKLNVVWISKQAKPWWVFVLFLQTTHGRSVISENNRNLAKFGRRCKSLQCDVWVWCSEKTQGSVIIIRLCGCPLNVFRTKSRKLGPTVQMTLLALQCPP